MFILLIQTISIFLIIVLPILGSVAFLTLLERKVRASIQTRRGPNVVGFYGFLQPLADGFKLLFKETIRPYRSNSFLFFFAPILSFSLSLLTWIVIPFNFNFVLFDINLSILYLLRLSSLNVYGIVLAGWSSSSKYTILGSLRAAAQRLSYEVSLGLTILPVILVTQSLSLLDIVESQYKIWFVLPFFPVFIRFFISLLAETNRVPFDLPEAEAELVSGFNTEYSARTFALFFLAEYANIILNSVFIVLLFLGGFLIPFINYNNPFFLVIKVLFFLYSFLWVRATFPRYRYDQLMNIRWKSFLPICLGYFIFISSFILLFNIYN